MRLDVGLDALLQLLHLAVVLHDVLAVDERAQQTVRRVLVLLRRRLLHHQLLKLLRVQSQLPQSLRRHRLLLEPIHLGSVFYEPLQLVAVLELLLLLLLLLELLEESRLLNLFYGVAVLLLALLVDGLAGLVESLHELFLIVVLCVRANLAPHLRGQL